MRPRPDPAGCSRAGGFALLLFAVLALSACDRADRRGGREDRGAAVLTDPDRITFPKPQLLELADGGRREVRSVLAVRRRLHYGDFVWNDRGVPPGTAWVRVDLDRQLISVFRGGHEIGTAVIIYGASDKPTPIGNFPVLQKAKDYRSRSYDAAMPYALRLTADGVALHASDVRVRAATHGCIGTPPEFARRMFAAIGVGDVVTIVGERPPREKVLTAR